MDTPIETPSSHTGEEQIPGLAIANTASVEKIVQLLKAKDDTSRFVGLALLKSTLDTSEELRSDEAAVTALWASISPRFLDRLLRTGSKPGTKQTDAKEMLDLAAHVIYTFTILLPDAQKSDSNLLGRVPLLVNAILQSSEETADIILRALLTIASSSPEGSTALAEVEDWSPLIEAAPKQPMVLSILAWTWTRGLHGDRSAKSARISKAISALSASYNGTDAVTLLDFLSKLLSRLDTDLIPANPPWLGAIISFIHNLTTSKPTAVSRQAYTNCAANLLVAYGDMASSMLFDGIFKSSKSLPYLLINLILIDIRASLPTLLEKLNTPEYPDVSERLTSALIILSFFINHLLQMIERADSEEDIFMEVQPELLLNLRDGVIETLSLVMEYLRDRWDAAVSGAQGLHPDARVGEAHTVSGSRKTLTWDSKHETAAEDRLLLAALKALGDWLREDDAPTLRREATGLIDLLMDLYQPSSAARVGVATRPLVLGALDGIIKEDGGVQTVLEYGGWSILSKDLVRILDMPEADRLEHELGQHISAILLVLAESRSATPEDWLDLVTNVAAMNVSGASQKPLSLQQLWADALELSAYLLTNAPPGIKKRFGYSCSALLGIAKIICDTDLDETLKVQIAGAVQLLAQDTVLRGS